MQPNGKRGICTINITVVIIIIIIITFRIIIVTVVNIFLITRHAQKIGPQNIAQKCGKYGHQNATRPSGVLLTVALQH